MKITICGSIAFIDQMYTLKKELEQLGHEVKLPPDRVPGEDGTLIDAKEYYNHKKAAQNNSWIWQNHSQRIKDHFNKVQDSEAILVVNLDKNNIIGYIGPNTLMEMGLAFHLNKKIYLLKTIPEVAYKEELIGMKPIVINFDLKVL